MPETGCEQFEIFQSAVNTNNSVLLELWTDQAALDVHGKANKARSPLSSASCSQATASVEDYAYHRSSANRSDRPA